MPESLQAAYTIFDKLNDQTVKNHCTVWQIKIYIKFYMFNEYIILNKIH
jgi:hypothetical protein